MVVLSCVWVLSAPIGWRSHTRQRNTQHTTHAACTRLTAWVCCLQACNGLEMDSRAIHLRHDNKKGARPRQRAPKNVAPGTEGAGGAPRGGNSDFKIFVGNLSWDTTWETLKEHFATAGDVEHADVMADKKTGRSKVQRHAATCALFFPVMILCFVLPSLLRGIPSLVRVYWPCISPSPRCVVALCYCYVVEQPRHHSSCQAVHRPS